MTARTKLRPILHVNITDASGAVLADMDAPSTADALAYYLVSRRIDERATEDIIKAAAETKKDDAPIVFVQRDGFDNKVIAEFAAAVH